MKLLQIISIIVLLCSCSFLKKSAEPESFVELTRANIGLLNGSYEMAARKNADPRSGDLYWKIFDRGYNNKDSITFIEIQVINCRKIRITCYDGDSIVKSRKFHGRIKGGYFKFRRKWFVVPMIFVNVYRNRILRIGILENKNLITDYDQISLGTIFGIIPFYENEHSNNIEFKRIEKK